MWFRSILGVYSARSSRKLARQNGHASKARQRPRSFRPRLDILEDRTLPSTFTVTNLLDTGPGSLRAAVTAANANPGADVINFAVTGTIALTSGELDITDSLTINGPGWAVFPFRWTALVVPVAEPRANAQGVALPFERLSGSDKPPFCDVHHIFRARVPLGLLRATKVWRVS